MGDNTVSVIAPMGSIFETVRYTFRPLAPVALVLMLANTAFATEYHVGPGQAFATIGAVPWFNLQPGDTVYIHYRATPYREKLLISSRGTPSQWIRVLGVPGPGGELPVISGDGATTSTNMHYRWQAPHDIQWLGVVQIAIDADEGPLPAYIEIANLQVQDGYSNYQFTAENGATSFFNGFAACIYAKSVQHLIVRNSVMTNCGQGFYNWTGDGSGGGKLWWDGVAADITLRGNHFYNNGHVKSYTEHQTYTEADGVTIEYNRFGPQRNGALGSQIKDRSAGTVIRYNYIEQSRAGWDIDLVESQESYAVLGPKASYKQAFVYGNIIVNKGVYEPSMIHWNEDHQNGTEGRATFAGAKLFFYNNTVLTVANRADMGFAASFSVFNTTYGGYDCPPGAPPGVIDVRNNIFAVLPRTAGSPIPQLKFGYCSTQKFDFGKNWVSPGWATGTSGTVTGAANIVSPAGNLPGFVDVNANDLHLVAGSSATRIGGALAPEVTTNSLGVALLPNQQYVYHQQVVARLSNGGVASDMGAFDAPPVPGARTFSNPTSANQTSIFEDPGLFLRPDDQMPASPPATASAAPRRMAAARLPLHRWTTEGIIGCTIPQSIVLGEACAIGSVLARPRTKSKSRTGDHYGSQ